MSQQAVQPLPPCCLWPRAEREYSHSLRSDVWAFNLNTLSWKPLIVPGVRCERQSDSSMWEVAVEQAPGPGQRAGHSCVVEEVLGETGSILTFGGSYSVSGIPSSVIQYTNDVWRLQLSGGQSGSSLTAAWVQLDVRGEPPSPRGGHAAAHVGGAMHVFGGCLGARLPSAMEHRMCTVPLRRHVRACPPQAASLVVR